MSCTRYCSSMSCVITRLGREGRPHFAAPAEQLTACMRTSTLCCSAGAHDSPSDSCGARGGPPCLPWRQGHARQAQPAWAAPDVQEQSAGSRRGLPEAPPLPSPPLPTPHTPCTHPARGPERPSRPLRAETVSMQLVNCVGATCDGTCFHCVSVLKVTSVWSRFVSRRRASCCRPGARGGPQGAPFCDGAAASHAAGWCSRAAQEAERGRSLKAGERIGWRRRRTSAAVFGA